MYDNIIYNKKGFNGYTFQDVDYIPISHFAGRTRDLKSILLVADIENFPEEELIKLNEYGKRFTERYDKHFKIRIGANYIHVSKHRDWGYSVKRDSWREGKYPETFGELCVILNRLLND